jgi:type I restriction enzyme S subunit
MRLSDVLELFEERLGARPEPEILTLTEGRGFISQQKRFNKRLATKDTSEYKVIRKYNIALNPYLLWAGAIAQNTEWVEAIISPVYPTFRIRDGFDYRFVDWLLRSNPLLLVYDSISFGSVPRRRRAAVEDFLGIPVKVPQGRDEQRRIAAILDKVQAVLRKRQEALNLIDEFLRSVFLEMFGDPATNPRGWSLDRLRAAFAEHRRGVCCGPFGSALKKSEYTSQGIPVWGIDNVAPNKFVEEGSLFISDEKHQQLAAYNVIDQDILISRAGTVGRMCVARPSVQRSIIGTNLIRLSLDSNILEPSFFTALYTFCADRMTGFRTSGDENAYSFMNTSTLAELVVPFPPIETQRKFTRLVEKTYFEEEKMRDQEYEIQSLFTALQHQSFRGERKLGNTPISDQIRT